MNEIVDNDDNCNNTDFENSTDIQAAGGFTFVIDGALPLEKKNDDDVMMVAIILDFVHI